MDKSSLSNPYNPDSSLGKMLKDSLIMVVDDDDAVCEVMNMAVKKAGYDCIMAPDGEEAYWRMMQEPVPDVVITDVDMPGMNGIELLKRIKTEYSADVIVMTGNVPGMSYAEIIRQGASDFVQKPVNPSEMVTRLSRVLKERSYRAEILNAHQKLMTAHEELQVSYLDSIHRLVLAAEYKDEDTGDHIIRIGRYSSLLAAQLGLPEKEVAKIGYAAPMHDIGKIGIPDQILLKPGRLTADEFEIMKTHTTIGAHILAQAKSEVIRCAQQIAISHHERWDGKGYPQGLGGDKIPLTGRIVALADTFDALTGRRPYKEPYPLEVTVDIMKKESGSQFDPELLDLFMENIDTIMAIKTEVQNIDSGNLGNFLLSERDRINTKKQAED
jgi:putative two-component system response regulator